MLEEATFRCQIALFIYFSNVTIVRLQTFMSLQGDLNVIIRFLIIRNWRWKHSVPGARAMLGQERVIDRMSSS